MLHSWDGGRYQQDTCGLDVGGVGRGGVGDPADPPTRTGAWRHRRFRASADGSRPENGLAGMAHEVDRPTAPLPSRFLPLRARCDSITGLILL